MKAKKKPVVVEFELYDGTAESVNRIIDMYGRMKGINNTPEGLYITTMEGIMKIDKGDYVILGTRGELYPRKPDIFQNTYDIIQ